MTWQLSTYERGGVSGLAVLRADGTLLKATTGGELADARSMGDAEVLKVFEGLASASH